LRRSDDRRPPKLRVKYPSVTPLGSFNRWVENDPLVVSCCEADPLTDGVQRFQFGRGEVVKERILFHLGAMHQSGTWSLLSSDPST